MGAHALSVGCVAAADKGESSFSSSTRTLKTRGSKLVGGGRDGERKRGQTPWGCRSADAPLCVLR